MAPDSSHPPSPDAQAIFDRQLQEVADETGYDRDTVVWILSSVASRATHPPTAGDPRPKFGAEALCEAIIRQIVENHPGLLRAVLEANEIFSSKDIGAIVNSLVEKGLLVREEDDFFTDFDDIFTTENLGPYLAKRGISQWLDWPGVKRRLSLALLAVGIGLIGAAHFEIIAQPYLIGWAVAACGLALACAPPRTKHLPPRAEDDKMDP